MPLSFAVISREAAAARRPAPPAEPANRWFLPPRATGRMARSDVVVVKRDATVVAAKGAPAGDVAEWAGKLNRLRRKCVCASSA
jgi:hypothetical protein